MHRYIFNSEGGQDRSGKSEKISMTSPVKAEMLDGGYKVGGLMTDPFQTGGHLLAGGGVEQGSIPSNPC